MCVRIAEPDEKIRLNVFKCLDILLKITAVYKGTFTESYINESEFIGKIMSNNNPESCIQLLEVVLQIFYDKFIFQVSTFSGHAKNISSSRYTNILQMSD